MPSYAPLSAGRPQTPFSPLEGIPVVGDTATVPGALAGTLGLPYAQAWFGAQGLSPMGMNGQSFADALRRQEFSRAQQELLTHAAQSERANFMRTFRGIGAMTGTPWGAQQEAAARSLAGYATAWSPLLAQLAPEALDAFGGSQGSPTVMALRMSMGSRYRIDPVTGRMGLSAESTRALHDAVTADLFAGGRPTGLQGVTAGQLGSLYDEFARRGMLPGAGGAQLASALPGVLQGMSRVDVAKAFADAEVPFEPGRGLKDLSAVEIDKLGSQPAIAGRLRAMDAKRVSQSLRDYTGAIAAMRELFGEAGQPNAPIPALLEGLEQLTQGGLGRLDPQRLATIVRTTGVLARQSGMSIDTVRMLQEHAGVRAGEIGIDRSLAIPATHGALAFGAAFRAEGGAVPAWGRYNADQMLQLDQNLRLQGADSEVANRLAVLRRARAQMPNGQFAAGSDAERAAQALTLGLTAYVDAQGRTRSLRMGDQDLQALLGAGAGLRPDAVHQLLRQSQTNAEFIDEPLMSAVRRMQGDEARSNLGRLAASAVLSRELGPGRSEEAKTVGDAIVRQMMAMPTRDFANRSLRQAEWRNAVQTAMVKAGRTVTDAEAGQIAGRLEGEFDAFAKKRGLGGIQNMQAMFNENTLRQGDRLRQQGAAEVDVETALASIGSPGRRALDRLREDPDADLGRILGEAFGGVAGEDVVKSLRGPLTSMKEEIEALEKNRRQLATEGDGPGRERLAAARADRLAALRGVVEKFNAVSEQHGLLADRVTPEDMRRLRDADLRQRLAASDVMGLRGGFARQVSDAERKAARGTRLTTADAEARKQIAELIRSKSEKDARTADDLLQADVAALEKEYGPEVTDILVRDRRSRIATKPTEERIQALMSEKGLSREAAIERGVAELQQKRWGTDVDLSGADPLGAMEAHAAARREKLYDVSSAEIAAYRQSHPQVTSDDAAKQAIVARRFSDLRQETRSFLASPSGGAQRKLSQETRDRETDVLLKSLNDEALMLRSGPRVEKAYRLIRGANQAELELAGRSGGDVERLRMRDYDFDVADPRGRKEAQEIEAEMRWLERQRNEGRALLQQAIGDEGGWGSRLDQELTVRAMLGVAPGVPIPQEKSNEYTRSMRAAGLASRLTMQDVQRLKTLAGHDRFLRQQADALGVKPEQLSVFLDRLRSGERNEDLRKAYGDRLTAEVADATRSKIADRDKLAGELGARAKEIGASSVEDLRDIADFAARYRRLRVDPLLESDMKPVTEHVKALGRQYGLTLSDADVREFAGRDESDDARARIRSLAEGTGHLDRIAARRAEALRKAGKAEEAKRFVGQDRLANVAAEVEQYGDDSEKLAAAYGISVSDARRLKTRASLLRGSKLLDLGRMSSDKERQQALLEGVSSAAAGRLVAEDAAEMRRMEISGTLTLQGGNKAGLDGQGVTSR